MTEDILTVVWKERRGLFRLQGSRVRTLLSLAVGVLVIAVVMPIQMGRDWLDSAWSLAVAFLIPLMLVGTMVPESFAGERERHTLETLLASRLPDRAILFGKLLLGVAYGWVLTLIVLALSLVVANLVHWTGRFAFFRPEVALGDAAVSLLVAGLIGSLGVLISLRASTVQGATQTLMFAFMVPLLLLQLVPMLLLSVVPNGREILHRILSVDLTTVVLVMVGILLVLDVALLLWAMARFRRARLILD